MRSGGGQSIPGPRPPAAGNVLSAVGPGV